MDNNACALKRRIGAYRFAVWEMTLYLDTHPDCTAALEKLREFQAITGRLVEEYEQQYGPLVLTSDDVPCERWSWVDGPWPWEGAM